MKKAEEIYNEIIEQFDTFDKEYGITYPIYESLLRADFRLSSDFWQTLMLKLHRLETLHNEIEKNILKLNVGLQQSLESRLKSAKECLNLIEHCCQQQHIQKNWVRMRIWVSGHFSDDDTFIPDHILKNLTYQIRQHPRANVGHASETATGYISF